LDAADARGGADEGVVDRIGGVVGVGLEDVLELCQEASWVVVIVVSVVVVAVGVAVAGGICRG
jgi:hypothetical protein